MGSVLARDGVWIAEPAPPGASVPGRQKLSFAERREIAGSAIQVLARKVRQMRRDWAQGTFQETNNDQPVRPRLHECRQETTMLADQKSAPAHGITRIVPDCSRDQSACDHPGAGIVARGSRDNEATAHAVPEIRSSPAADHQCGAIEPARPTVEGAARPLAHVPLDHNCAAGGLSCREGAG